MPAKLKRRQLQQDWSWVGTDVSKVEDITPEHWRRAAGLVDVERCPFPLQHARKAFEVYEERHFSLDSKCTASRCRRWPGCLNHLGAEELVAPGAKEDFITLALDSLPERRNGHAGLRNLGATCYAAAFLQLWFHNIPFRNGVYRCVTAEGTPLYHLALVFAQLQFSEKSIVDPMGLIEALRLNTGDQQDAAEFSKLFMSLIASEFAKQPDPALKSLLTDLFEGTLEYTTQCDQCKYQSETTSSFLELELSLGKGSTLDRCIQQFFGFERLDGANKYFCSRCNALRPATRSVRPTRLPPVLHFSLMRFVFDQATMSRKKSKASISYSKEINLGGKEYELQGIVTHLGTSAHHGHFICDVFDQEWLRCNDETVTKIEVKKSQEPDKKKARLYPNDEASKDAYMLVYKIKGTTKPIMPPAHIMEKVTLDNAVFESEMDHQGLKRRIAEDTFCFLQAGKMDVVKALPGNDYLVSRDALEKWIQAKSLEDLFKPFDNAVCEHGAVDPENVGDYRLISWSAADKLTQYMTFPGIDVCQQCVEDGFLKRLNLAERTEQLATFEVLNEGQAEYMVPRAWLKLWKARKADAPSGEHSLRCEHAHLSPTAEAEVITSDAFQLLQSLYELDPIKQTYPTCEICAAATEDDEALREVWVAQLKFNRGISKEMNTKPPVFKVEHYLLPPGFDMDWKDYISSFRARPLLVMPLCEHGFLTHDPGQEPMPFITAKGWDMLTREDSAPAITFQFSPNPLPGNRTNVIACSHQVCQPCRAERLLDFTATSIRILLPKDPVNLGTKRSTRSRDKEREFQVTKQTTIKDLKVRIYDDCGISPINQRLYYNDRELNSDDVIGALKVLAGDTITCVEVLDGDDFEQGGIEGFGGTALSGLTVETACRQCTLINQVGAISCEACGDMF
ncbi:hypothetical protein BCR39DRAFT_541321 [Naematelia encephala]|uniref:Ubiquitin carboxyl-terminal hydrolase n=1 Tax=Naematelia encephala TaxID=71784 RepID=A0A1Y2AUR1_9TREE|nr:hypothetical protein BCR39DRAFT_541321 [Naematelia encephala]